MSKRRRTLAATVLLAGLAAALLSSFLQRNLTTAPPAQGQERPNRRDPAPAAGALAPPHPLDPLRPEEMKAAVQVLKDEHRLPEGALFPLLVVKEPPKDQVLTWRPGMPVLRHAFAVVLDRVGNTTFESVIDLEAKKTVSWKAIPGAQPSVLFEESALAARLVRADARWQKAMRDRGYKDADLDRMQLDAWAYGALSKPGRPSERRLRVATYYRGDASHGYGRPIEGVVAVVNLNRGTVDEVVDRRPAVPAPEDAGDFLHGVERKERARPGPARYPFEVRDHELHWRRWSFRYALHPREGLVLYAVRYKDEQKGGEWRSVLYRASVAELVIPYAEPDETWEWRSAFDEGEYGLGKMASRLWRGHEVPDNAALLSALLADDHGEPTLKKDETIAVYEQDGGILWNHTTDFGELRAAARRARQLVVHNIFTVDNYDYGIKWLFGEDGTIEFQAELTGILLAKAVADARCPVCEQQPDAEGRLTSSGSDRYGELVSKNLVAVNHQHFFSVRLDLDVDGPKNSVQELNVRSAAAGEAAPANVFVLERRLLRTELEAQRDLNLQTHRAWKVINPNVRTALGHFPGYRLEPGPNTVPHAHPTSAVRRRGGFLDHHLWVTPHRPREFYPAGDYPNQASGGDGLPRWTGANRPLVNDDVVVWYTLGLTHVPRPEEWPVMPVARAGFRLVPDGFFVRNPVLDLP
jgi:primary-amine oxidase